MQASRNVVGGIGNLMFKEAYLLGQVLDKKLPDTYLQQYSLWWTHAPEIRAYFSEGIIIDGINKVSLHIRRGDYLKAKHFYVDLTAGDYYQRAVKEMDEYWMKNALSGYDVQSFANSPTYLVFCKDNQGWEQDKADRQWCRDFLDTFIPGRYELVSKDNLEHEDMNLMASCKAHIGANSSFSWWACFLGGGKCIMPKQWFVENTQAVPVEMLPEWELL